MDGSLVGRCVVLGAGNERIGKRRVRHRARIWTREELFNKSLDFQFGTLGVGIELVNTLLVFQMVGVFGEGGAGRLATCSTERLS